MMLHGTDKTAEVEKRMEAIRITLGDCCAFFEKRPTSPVDLRECWYCKYAAFESNHETGYCKFKSRENIPCPAEKEKTSQNACEILDQDLDCVAGGLTLPPKIKEELMNASGGGCSGHGSDNKDK